MFPNVTLFHSPLYHEALTLGIVASAQHILCQIIGEEDEVVHPRCCRRGQSRFVRHLGT
jgi:hypothetical protein